MSTALNTDAHDGPPAEAVAIVGTDGLPAGSVPDVTVKTLGVPRIASPMAPLLASRQTTEHYVDETDRVLLDDTLGGVIGRGLPVDQLPGLEPCGPRRKIFFDPSKTRVAIVTCGGLCPGLNDVIAGLVRNLTYHYGVRRVIGFRNGYQGFIPAYGHDVDRADPRDGARHLRRRRHRPRHLARPPGPRGDRRLPGAAQHQHAVRHRRRRLDARRDADRAGDRASGACGSPSSASPRPSTTTSRSSTRASASRRRSAWPATRSGPRTWRRSRRRTASAWSSSWAGTPASSPATPRWPAATPTSC